MNELDRYFQIISEIFTLFTTGMTAYCYALMMKPFFSDQSPHRLQKSRTRITAAVYMGIMLFLNYMPYYINGILAHGIGILVTCFVVCLLDPVYISQKLFLSFTFFSLRWQAWRIVGQLGIMWMSLDSQFFAYKDTIFWFRLFILECTRDALTGFFLMYGGVRLFLRVYGKKQEHMRMREFLILVIPSLSGLCAYIMIYFYLNVYTDIPEQTALSKQIGYETLILIYAVICYTTTLVIIWLFRQWKNEHEEDKRREIFLRQMQDLESHITETERFYKDIRTLRHDMGNHLMTLKHLYAQGESEAAEAYAASLQEQMQTNFSGITSGNPVTDVILTDHKKEMHEKGIDFTCDFHYPTDSNVNAFDISIILNNGLSNAIEAVEKETSSNKDTAPFISLSSRRIKNMYVIEIVNSFTGELKTDVESGFPFTTKKGEGHGFGLSSIRQAAHKYLGDTEIKKEIIENRECCVLRVMLQITTPLA